MSLVYKGSMSSQGLPEIESSEMQPAMVKPLLLQRRRDEVSGVLLLKPPQRGPNTPLECLGKFTQASHLFTTSFVLPSSKDV